MRRLLRCQLDLIRLFAKLAVRSAMAMLLLTEKKLFSHCIWWYIPNGLL